MAAILIATLIAYINHKNWGEKLTPKFHVIQWLGVAVIGTIFSLIFYDWKFIPLFSAIYWIVFEAALYSFRGLPLLYVGKTAQTDRIITWVSEILLRGYNKLAQYKDWYGEHDNLKKDKNAKSIKAGLKAWMLLGALYFYFS